MGIETAVDIVSFSLTIASFAMAMVSSICIYFELRRATKVCCFLTSEVAFLTAIAFAYRMAIDDNFLVPPLVVVWFFLGSSCVVYGIFTK